MPLDALQKEILDDAKRASGEIEAKARREADAIIREAKARAGASNEEFERGLSDEIGRISLEYRSAREMQERNLLLSARERLVDGLVDRIRAHVLKRVRERGYKKIFDSAIKEALKISPMDGLTLVMDKKDAKFARGFSGRIKYAKVDGLTVYAADGRIKIDATLDTLFDRNRDAVKEAVRRGVFGVGKAKAAKKGSAKKAARKRAPKSAAGRKAAKPKPKRKRK
jgi:vacuolar-type H+-ATPase subunit E/Vma4